MKIPSFPWWNARKTEGFHPGLPTFPKGGVNLLVFYDYCLWGVLGGSSRTVSS